MRTKTAYEVTKENGKKKPVKVGLAPVQREGIEYEFTLVFDLTVEGHVATAAKDRTTLFSGQHFTPTVETGATLRAWLEGGHSGALGRGPLALILTGRDALSSGEPP